MIDFKKYFSDVVFINLDKRPDRLQHFVDEMKKFDIQNNYNRVSGVDGKYLTNNSRINNGELGILETHLRIIKDAKERNLESILIMEDDVYFTDEIKKVDEYMSAVPDDWDMIYFGGNHVYGQKPEKINDKIIKLNFTVALQCVVVRNTMYDQIIELLPKKEKQVDAYYGDLQKKNNCYCFYPNIAKQKRGYSDIQNRGVDYDHFFNIKL